MYMCDVLTSCMLCLFAFFLVVFLLPFRFISIFFASADAADQEQNHDNNKENEARPVHW